MSTSPWSDLDRPPLDAAGLSRALTSAGGLWREIRVVDETGSTNADLVAAARAGAGEGLVLVAEHQTAARGRLGRTWSTPARSGLNVSVLLAPTEIPTGRWSLLPLLAGTAAALATAAVAGLDVGLKWPNDVLVGERKLAGILAERADRPAGAAAIVGIGLNVSLKVEELPVETATSLALEGAQTTDRSVVLRSLLRAIEDEYTSWRLAGGDPTTALARYRGLCRTLGREVRAHLPGGLIVRGRAVEVDRAGSLVIETSDGRRTVSAGDVIHLR